ncbi:hypothetical protein FGB62_87g061 [Gracilaria domingensis]|nr:hypothetical protein FGB62_87g061 [Gracilaria domingensis]
MRAPPRGAPRLEWGGAEARKCCVMIVRSSSARGELRELRGGDGVVPLRVSRPREELQHQFNEVLQVLFNDAREQREGGGGGGGHNMR